ncbi:RHS repeat-associated core domain-containing protein [Kitasatospora sp. NPDC101235]|uniref:RHS repeat-associated core domain-containing protein n=1 Tax=Kitasatospora sp. NPDC101235 TaxID=3364101 RepID=UPI00380E8093
MASTSSLFTHATNFSSAVSGGVDPRTGLFNLQITLGELVGNRTLGPSVPLTLSYSPLTRTDMGFGQGVSVRLTTYDVDSRLLALSTGEQYRVEETGTKVVLMQHKLDTVRITREQDAYRIAHKSGDVEILTAPRNASSLKVPTALLTSTGHRLTLSWDFATGAQPRLTAVKDEHDTLLTVAYAGQSKTTVRVLPGQREGYDVDLRFRNGLLGSVHHFGPGADKPLVWDFTHTLMGEQGEWGSWITGATTPGGMSETAYYRNDGHRFPVTANLPPLPCVYRFVQTPGGGQPPVEASYSYTDTNYVGGHSDVDWNSDRDCLYEILSDYSYGSTESRACAGQTTRITRTYDNYHLQTAERQQQNACSRLVETQYYAVTGKLFEEQPAQFQLPKKKMVTWTDSRSTGPNKSYQEVTETVFDECGNPKDQTNPDGTRTVWEYYPAGGSGDDCPREPNGFTRLLKSVTHTPPHTEFDAPVHTTVHRYGAHKATPDPRVPTAVLKSEEQRKVDGQLLQKQAFTYDTSGEEYGRLTRLTTTDYPDDGGSGQFESVNAFSSSVKDDTMVQVNELTTHDHLTVKRSQTRSRFTGRLRSATDPQGNVATMVHDNLGRLLSHTANPGTAYQAVERRTYETGTSAPFVATSTDALGNQIRESFDGAGRLIRRERKDIDDDHGNCNATGSGAWYTVCTQSHDEQGRVTSVAGVDRVRGDAGTEIKLTRTYAYDDWGQCSTTTLDDGSGGITLHDPVNRTTTTQRLGGGKPLAGKTVTTYDKRGAPVSATRLDRNDSPAGTRTFKHDGLGRLRSETDELGHTTTYDYDVRDRLRRTTLPDSTQISRAYAQFSAQKLVTGLTVGTTSYGTQSFDGLGRLTRTTSGGRTWSCSYGAACDPLPSTTRPPGHPAREYQYLPQLANAVSQVKAGSLTQRFTRHQVSGALTKAEEGDVTLTRDYYPSGLLCATTTRLTGHADATTHTTYTVNGLEQNHTGVDGTIRQITRDTFGRPLAVVDPAAQATLRYDSAGRVIGWTTEDSQSKNTLITDLSLDEFGREVTRTLTDSQGTTWTLVQEWQRNDLLSRRTLARGNTKLRAEIFAYSSRNQLTAYTCTGQTPAQDEHGRAITGQIFTYDAYGNIRTCRTDFADGGSDTATYLFGNPADPCQLTGVDHDNPKSHTDLHYDTAGRLVTDDAGRSLAYDDLGRLTKVGTVSTYGYDPQNQLLTQGSDGRTSVFSYHRQILASVTDGDQRTRLIRLGQSCVAQRREGPQTSTRLMGTDGKQTVLVAAEGQQHDEYAYTPYGDRRPAAVTSVLGHDGQRTDPATGWYHLGNGTRAYSPVLMRFTTPDALSPFGAGGVNPYAYCLGDPINRTDPTGHLSWQAWFGIGAGILGLGLAVFTGGASIAAATGVWAAVATVGVAADVVSSTAAIVSGALEEAAPKASGILGWVSLGTGVAALGTGVAALGTGLGTAAARGLSRLATRSAQAAGAAEAAAAEGGSASLARFYGQLAENTFGADEPQFAAGNTVREAASEAPAENSLHGAVGGQAADRAMEAAAAPRRTMYHYTTPEGRQGILETRVLNPSHPYWGWRNHAHAGSGQYLTDRPPSSFSSLAERSETFVENPHETYRFSRHLEIDVTDQLVHQPWPDRPNVFVIHSYYPLDLTGRILNP